MKIFEFNGKRNGSYIDSVSGAVGVNTNGEWAKTEKGTAWRGNGSDSSIDTGINPNISTEFSFVCWANSKVMGVSDLHAWDFRDSSGDGARLTF